MIKKRFKSDDGSSMTIFILSAIVLVIFIGVFILDTTKNRYLKNFYDNATQRSVLVAVKEQNTVGGLTANSVKKFIVEYYGLRGTPVYDATFKVNGNQNYGTNDSAAFRGIGCVDQNGGYPKIKITFDNSRRIGSGNNSLVIEIPPIKNTGYQNIPVLVNGVPTNLNSKTLNDEISRRQYNVLNAEVVDVSGNFMMGMIGQKCSEFVSVKSANSINTYNNQN